MKIRVVGCGSAFSLKNFNQSFLLEEGGKRLLIDCGRNIPEALSQAGIDVKTINAVYISHAHADHIGGLEYLALSLYDWQKKPTRNPSAPVIIANEHLMKNLWTHSLQGGLETMEGFVADIQTFFKPYAVAPNKSFLWEGWKVSLVQQIHVMSGSVVMPSFGLFIEKRGRKAVYFTTDAQFFQPKQVKVFYDSADIIFQDCECAGVDMANRRYVFNSGVHASYAELAGYPSANASVLPRELKKKIMLSHYQDFVSEGTDFLNNVCDWEAEAKKDGFAGWAHVGDVYEI